MARTVQDTNLDTRQARTRLTARHKPYWRLLDQGCHLGYYKGKRSTAWIARYFLGQGRYAEQRLGLVDDLADADGVAVLTFKQAQAAARKWFSGQAHKVAGLPLHDGPYSVGHAIRDYLGWLESEGKRSAQDHRTRAEAVILPELGSIEVAKLTPARIRAWRDGLANTPARLRTRKGATQNYRPLPKDDETKDRRKSTANRTLTILKAALNHAFHEGQVESDAAWRRVKPYQGVDATRLRWLKHDQAMRLINACPEDFRSLVSAALVSGARYGELSVMKVGNFDPGNGTVFVAKSKSGKARHVVLTDEGAQLFASLTIGRSEGELIFLKSDGEPWHKSNQARRLRAACKAARIDPAVTFHELRHTYASLSLMAGMDLMVLAGNLGHAGTRMVEKHYGHISDEHRAKIIRDTAPHFGLNIKSKATAITLR